MKRFSAYINTMYRPSVTLLKWSLMITCSALLLLAFILRSEMLSGASDLIYRYPQMIEELVFPLFIAIPMALITDANERRKNG